MKSGGDILNSPSHLFTLDSMSASKKITGHLGKNKVKFEIVTHKKVYTAYDLAQTLGHTLDGIAKTLLVHADIPEIRKKGKLHYVLVVPASYNIDLAKVKRLLKAKKVDFVKEKMIGKLGVKPGAISPFGSVRGFGVVMDKALLKTKEILVGAESFTESVRMKVKDFVAIEAPVVGVIGKRNKLKLQSKGRRGGGDPKRKAKKGDRTAKKKVVRKPVKKKFSRKAGKRMATRTPVKGQTRRKR